VADHNDELLALLVDHTDAWNAHDLDSLMALFADDCVFEAAGGDEACGTTYAGRESVRAAFAEIYAALPDGQWTNGRHSAIGPDYGVSEWLLSGTLDSGERLEIYGCDFLTVRDGKIINKDSYTKDRPPIDPV
jgi:ketosteroid isomerase-like protein